MLVSILLLISLFLGGVSDLTPAPQGPGWNTIANEFKWFQVTKVVDGDSFWISDGSPKGQKIRMIGVDAPESRSAFKKQVGYYGKEAKTWLHQLLTGKMVRLEYDVSRKDRYGRTLAYVYLKDGSFVNALLLQNGYATTLTVPPNIKYVSEFSRLQKEAREQKRGLWKK